jgi:hypothetical protein
LPVSCRITKLLCHCIRRDFVRIRKSPAGYIGDEPVLRLSVFELSRVSDVFQIVALVCANALDIGGRISRRLLGAGLENLLGEGILSRSDSDCAANAHRRGHAGRVCGRGFQSGGFAIAG